MLSVWVMSLCELHATSDLKTQHNVPFIRHPNSIAVLSTHISDQSAQRTFWVPLVPFLFGNAHITFCPQNTQVNKSCITSSSQFQRHFTFHWCRSVRMSIYTAVLQASAHSSFGSPLAWNIERALSTIVRFSCSAVLFCSGVWHGESVRKTVFF